MIDSNYFLMVVAIMTVGTILIRGSFISFSGKIKNTEKLKNLFSYIPAAIFPAIIIPGSFYHPQKGRFVILLAAIVVSYFIRNTLFIVSFGLILLYLVTQVF
jgi:branched-subunit amino acid transport protein